MPNHPPFTTFDPGWSGQSGHRMFQPTGVSTQSDIGPAFDSEPLAEASQVGGTFIPIEHDNGVIRGSGAVGSAREVAT